MDTTPNGIERRKRIVQDYLLIWLDESTDETNTDYKHILTQVQIGTNNVSVFTQRDECVDFLSDSGDIKSFLVIENTIAKQIIPLINDISQLDGIYIFTDIKIQHEEWNKKWQKIKSVHTNIKDLCEALQLDVKQHNQDSIAMSFVTGNEMASTDDLNQLEPTFMYTQIFKDILLDMEHGEQAIKQFTAYCRHHDSGSAKIIDEFEKNYDAQSAIWWYSYPSFLYSMLNYALRSMEGDTIINMGFFIHDLHQQIQYLHQQQVNNYHDKPLIVYRGQGLFKANFEKLKKIEGGLMSFNNFLSTSIEQEIAFGFAFSASENTDMVGILFIMSIDPCIKSAPFASIKEKSYFKKENEILFSMHTVFRVGVIKQMDNNNQLYQVELQLTSDHDQQLRLLTDRIGEEVGGTGWQKLGDLLLKIGQFNKAEEFYNVLIEQTSHDDEKQYYYNRLGYVKEEQGDYEKAIWYHEQGLEIFQKTLPSNHPSLATSYSNVGSVYDKMEEYSKALSYYEKALEIFQNTLPSNHSDVATSYNNIGNVYNHMGEHSAAVLFYEKALKIFQNTLPSNHPSLAASYNNIGTAYNTMGQYSKVLSYYEKSLEIYQKTLPSNHPHLATLYGNISNVYENTGEHSKALSFHKKTLGIFKKTLSSNHPHLGTSYNNTGLMYKKIGEYSKALLFYEKALKIRQKTLPSNHPSLATSYNNIGNVYSHMGEYSKALSFYEKALEIRQKTVPSNHPDLATSCNNIGNVYDNMGAYSTALSYHEKALEIQRKILPSNHLDLAISYNNIGWVYRSMKDYSKTLSYYERALNIWECALPSTHPHIKNVKNSIEIVKKKL
ncbi:unnamed protein product [Adineta steineri]|uniref:NAD(P)(+)--arginine ADP-ribosyltransferase n=1 Tax=Adineta steineri TaxID=433720 RepID=A0A814R712_9BILA|nr:unnamed protein product [Adineta steineri]CAF3975337.1 unnamed protein product [Adineta steineri]